MNKLYYNHFKASGLEILNISDLFCEIFKFCENMNTKNFMKSVFGHIFMKFKYFAKQITYSEAQDQVFKMIYNLFTF